MKTFIAVALVVVVSQTAAFAQSRGGSAGWIGNMRQGGKAAIASGKDLGRAERYAQQAQKRLGNTPSGSAGGGWAAGGMNWNGSRATSRR